PPAAAVATDALRKAATRPEVTEEALLALGRVAPGDEVWNDLKARALSTDATLRLFEGLAELREPAAPILAEVIHHDVKGVRWSIDALGTMGASAGKLGVESLLDVIRAGRKTGKQRSRFDAALTALERIGPPAAEQALPVLTQIAEHDENEQVRARA